MKLLVVGLSLLPLSAGATDQANAAVMNILGKLIEHVIDPLVMLCFAAAFLIFMWGLLQFMMSMAASNTDKPHGMDVGTGKRHLLWGLIGMVIMFSVGGILGVLTNSLGVSNKSIEVEGGFK